MTRGDNNFIRSSIKLYGFDEDPDVITSIVGRAPTKFWRKGDYGNYPFMLRERNAWIIELGLDLPFDVEVHIENALMTGRAILESTLAIKSERLISIAIGMHDSAPKFRLSASLLHRLYQLKMSLDVDNYIIP